MSVVSLEKNPFAPYFARFTRPELASFLAYHSDTTTRQYRAALAAHRRLVKSDLRSFIRNTSVKAA